MTKKKAAPAVKKDVPRDFVVALELLTQNLGKLAEAIDSLKGRCDLIETRLNDQEEWRKGKEHL